MFHQYMHLVTLDLRDHTNLKEEAPDLEDETWLEFLQRLEYETDIKNQENNRLYLLKQAEIVYHLALNHVQGEKKVQQPIESQIWAVRVDGFIIWDYDKEQILYSLNFKTSIHGDKVSVMEHGFEWEYTVNMYVREQNHELDYIVELDPSCEDFYMVSKNCSALIEDMQGPRNDIDFKVTTILPYEDESEEDEE